MSSEQADYPMRVRLFGPVEVVIHGRAIQGLHVRRKAWLLALLILRKEQERNRPWMLDWLWNDENITNPEVSFRQSLHQLKQDLQEEKNRLLTTSETIKFDLTGAFVDVLEFDRFIKKGDIPSLERAVELYRGPLLEECSQSWVLNYRKEREKAYKKAIRDLAANAIDLGQHEAAIAYWQQALALTTVWEEGCQGLMRAYWKAQHYNEALAVYQDFRRHLKENDAKAAPDPNTAALYDQIRNEALKLANLRAQRKRKAPSTPPRALPHFLTELIGRETDIQQIEALLRRSRLLTLTGPGGVGKTRLAGAVADQIADECVDGAWWVDLASIKDPVLVEPLVARVLGIPQIAGQKAQSLEGYLKRKDLLLVLDNCEHLLNACVAVVVKILRTCPTVRIILTSREPIGVDGEFIWRVESLPSPDPAVVKVESTEDMEQLRRYAAIRMFEMRAQAARRTFQLTTANASAIALICHRLDGIPLAIELVASCIQAHSPPFICEQLNDVFRLPTSGEYTRLPRQQTLRAVVDWSYALLEPQERILFQCLAVFVDGWSREAVQEICKSGNLPSSEILKLLTHLVGKSLVQHDDQDRYRMLETIRQYAAEQLAENGEAEDVRTRHRDYYLRLAEATSSKLERVDAAPWLTMLEQEHGNLRSALHWSIHGPNCGDAGLRLAGALRRFWDVRGHYAEGRRWYESALSQPTTQALTHNRAVALNGAGMLAFSQGDLKAAQYLYEESEKVTRFLNDMHYLSTPLNNLGLVAAALGDRKRAWDLYSEALAIEQGLHDLLGEAILLTNMGELLIDEERWEEARELLERSGSLREKLGAPAGLRYVQYPLGLIALRTGQFDKAESLLKKSLIACRTVGDPRVALEVIGALGELAHRKHQKLRAVQLWGAVPALREKLGIQTSARDQKRMEDGLSELRNSLEEHEFQWAWRNGSTMSLEQAMELALQE